MSWRTNRTVIALRNVGRAVGLNRVVGALRNTGRYEDRFQSAMLESVRPGDVVWDVGANVGLYSKMFAERAGAEGRVFAYEPSPINLERLRGAVQALDNVTVLPLGLGDSEKVVSFEQGADALGATSRVIENAPTDEAQGIRIRIVRGDDLIAAGAAAPPNVIKIDTEGYELDVLLGLARTLSNERLRLLCIEVHFRLLEERGLSGAPSEIEARLAAAGFSVSWPDASHIVARRLH
jgi:FkbM family methyltransferase